METISSELNVFEVAVRQSTFEAEIVPTPLATIIQGARLNFQIEVRRENCIELSNTKMEGSAKLTVGDETHFAADTPVGVFNLALLSMFQSVTMKIGDNVALSHSAPCSAFTRQYWIRV